MNPPQFSRPSTMGHRGSVHTGRMHTTDCAAIGLRAFQSLFFVVAIIITMWAVEGIPGAAAQTCSACSYSVPSSCAGPLTIQPQYYEYLAPTPWASCTSSAQNVMLNFLQVNAGSSLVTVDVCVGTLTSSCTQTYTSSLGISNPLSCIDISQNQNLPATLTGSNSVVLRVTCAQSTPCTDVYLGFVTSCPTGTACQGPAASSSTYSLSCTSCTDNGCGILSGCQCSDGSGGVVSNNPFSYFTCPNYVVTNNQGMLACQSGETCAFPASGTYASSCTNCVDNGCGYLFACRCTNPSGQYVLTYAFAYFNCPNFVVQNNDGYLACSPPSPPPPPPTTPAPPSTWPSYPPITEPPEGPTYVWSSWSSSSSSNKNWVEDHVMYTVLICIAAFLVVVVIPLTAGLLYRRGGLEACRQWFAQKFGRSAENSTQDSQQIHTRYTLNNFENDDQPFSSVGQPQATRRIDAMDRPMLSADFVASNNASDSASAHYPSPTVAPLPTVAIQGMHTEMDQYPPPGPTVYPSPQAQFTIPNQYSAQSQ